MLTFSANDLLGRLTGIAQATTCADAVEIGEPALGLLHWYPETSCYARILNGSESYYDGTGNDEMPLPVLQEKLGRVFPKIQASLGRKSDFTLPELVEMGHPGKLALRNPIRDVVLASGHPSLYAESLPLILGGLFTFAGGGWAEIRWDERSRLENYRPFPTGLVAVVGGGDQGDAPAVAATWNQAQRLERMAYQCRPAIGTRQKGHYLWRNGGSTSSATFNDKLRRFTRTRHEILPDHEDAFLLTYDYPRHSKSVVEHSNLGIVIDRNLEFLPVSLEVISQPQDLTLSFSVPQFLYLPGAVLETSALHPAEVLHNDLTRILSSIPLAREMRGGRSGPDHDNLVVETVPGPGGPIYCFGSKTPGLPTARVQFDVRNTEGIPLEWRLEMDLPPLKGSIEALRVTDDTVDAVERYVKGKFKKGLDGKL
jgi:hypothetical protein